LRIGELARRAGIPPATLRAWERRYGIVSPIRTEVGYRLYGERDERRIKRMLELITRGIAPAEAASRVLGEEVEADAESDSDRGGPDRPAPERALDGEALRTRLLDELMAYDEGGAQTTLDRAVAAYGVEALLTELILPMLRRIGERWTAGEITIGQEHFASHLIRGRLMPLARGWSSGEGPLALLACPAGEEHDLALLAFGLLLGERGWRVAFLGADTPLETLEEAAERLRPEVVVLAITDPATAASLNGELSLQAPVAIAGAAAGGELAERIGARQLEGDLVTAADQLTSARSS
jgi:DNA-binding transcriptional MerR regulator